MKEPRTGSIPHGPAPWRQRSWDARAAGNFMLGGAGAGLVACAALAGLATGPRVALVVGGVVLVNLGLVCVALELGRPLRALNVFRNPRASWMSREAIAATLLTLAGALALLGGAVFVWPALALALGFAWCQANLLRAARGIPAWREPAVVPLLLATALAEGGGLLLVAAPWLGAAGTWPLALVALLVVARLVAWLAYRQRVDTALAENARVALDAAGRALVWVGTIVPLVLALAAWFAGPSASTWLAALAGLAALVAGSWFKFALVTRAGYNQGFALPQLPVRGVRA